MEIKVKKRELKLTDIEGELHILNFPTAKRMNSFMEDIRKFIKGDADKNDYELSRELLIECGMTEKGADSLYSEDMKEIIKVLDGQKKI